MTRNQWFKQKHIATKRNYIKELCIKLRREQGKPDIDIEDIEEIEDVEEIEEIEDIVMEFEDRLWATDEDVLKDRLAAKARKDPQLHKKLKLILDEIDRCHK